MRHRESILPPTVTRENGHFTGTCLLNLCFFARVVRRELPTTTINSGEVGNKHVYRRAKNAPMAAKAHGKCWRWWDPTSLFKKKEKFPKAQVDIFISVIENDGNALSAGILCASIALGQAGIEMYGLVSSCSLVQKGVTSIMDPTFEESTSSEVDGKVTLAFLPTMNVISGLLQEGELDHDQVIKAVKYCKEGCVRVYPVLQECLVHTVKQAMKSNQDSGANYNKLQP